MAEVKWDREYICRACYMVYWGYMDPALGGREPCPSCGAPSPSAADTFACFYWEQELGEKYGADFFETHYWWRRDRVPMWEWARYEKHSWREDTEGQK